MIAYKIVTIDRDGKRYGLYNFLGSSSVEYLTDGSIIKPKISNSVLFVFKDLDIAKIWVRKDTELWEVECEDLQVIKEYVCCPVEAEIIAYWNGEKEYVNDGKRIPIITWIGIDSREFYGCSSLKMIKKIE